MCQCSWINWACGWATKCKPTIYWADFRHHFLFESLDGYWTWTYRSHHVALKTFPDRWESPEVKVLPCMVDSVQNNISELGRMKHSVLPSSTCTSYTDTEGVNHNMMVKCCNALATHFSGLDGHTFGFHFKINFCIHFSTHFSLQCFRKHSFHN